LLGSRLARRIVLPVLLLLGALFGVLAFAALQVADSRVAEELDRSADRVAATLDGLRVPRERWPELLGPLARAVGVEIIVDRAASRDFGDGELAGIGPGLRELGGTRYRILARRPSHGPGRYLILTADERVQQRRRDVLRPILWTGAAGLAVAVLLGVAIARTIARPVRTLADRAARFAAGDYEAGAPSPRGPGEIGDLQVAFDKMAAAIQESETQLRESERFAALGRLAGGIAHELRNPLTAIRMAVETATEKGSEGRDIAVAEIERLDRTLREMLDYVRPRKPTLAAVELRTLFEEIVALLGPQCRHLRVELESEDPGDATVLADKDRVKQALLNLVLNAAQAQPYGGVVRLRVREGAIEVADDGPGIPQEVRESLLQPFVTTKEAGIGLGLAVVQQVADEHGADLAFQTGPEGTVFRLVFRDGLES